MVTSEVLGISVIPDGGCAISGVGTKPPCLGPLEWAVPRHLSRASGAVTCVDITPDGRYAVSSEDSETCVSGVLVTRKVHRQTPQTHGLGHQPGDHTRWQNCVSGSEDKCLVLWDLSRKNCQNVLQAILDAISCVEITPDGHLAVSGSWDKSLRVWDLQEGRCLRTLQGHAQRVSSVAVTPDGRLAISGSHDHTIRIWNLRTGECRQVLHGHTDRVTSVSLTPDGRLAVSRQS
ncbi:MAG: WD40 repeat domain-containing protein [Verrucomicrobiales bacterium]